MTLALRCVAARSWLLALAALLAVAGPVPVRAQNPAPAKISGEETMVHVDVVVAAVSGGIVFFDKGRSSSIEPGDPVVVYPAGGPMVPGIVQSVSRTSCRAELPDGAPAVTIGDRGEVLVPEARTLPAAGEDGTLDKADGSVPDHPAWAQQPENFDTSHPLLAPVFNRPDEEKPMLIYGRWFTQYNGTWDKENDNSYELVRTGIDLSLENPFGAGGLIHVNGDLSRNTSTFGNGEEDQTDRARLDRASYRWGGTREERNRWEVGRFLQHEFPELGVLDGIEVVHRTDAGNHVGGSFGAMPEPFPTMKTGQDTQAAVFYRTGSDTGQRQPYEFGVAYQNTWHKGAQDRNLFVGTFDSQLSDAVSVDAQALVDYYGPGDSIKKDGLQVTEARARGLWRVSKDTGVGLHASKIRWPETKRSEFGDVTAQQILDNEVTRVGADGWHDLSEHLRVDGRFDAWQDQTDSGNSGDVRGALRDVIWDRGEVALDAFSTQGSFTDGHGIRLSGSRAFDSIGYGTLSWETSQYSGSAVSNNADTRQQALRASLDTSLGKAWSISLYAEKRFGSNQDSYNLGVYLQERF